MDPGAFTRLRDGDLARDPVAADPGGHRDRAERGGKDPPDRAEKLTGFVECGGEIAERLRKSDQDEVAQRMVGQLAGTETMLERAGPRAVVVVTRERDQAAAQVAGRRDVEVAPEAAGAAAVVGHAHDGGDLVCVFANGAQRDRQAVTSAQCNDARAHVRRRGRRLDGGRSRRSRGAGVAPRVGRR